MSRRGSSVPNSPPMTASFGLSDHLGGMNAETLPEHNRVDGAVRRFHPGRLLGGNGRVRRWQQLRSRRHRGGRRPADRRREGSRSLLDPNDTLTDEDIIASAGEKGMSAAVDGDAVIYTMTRLQREELLTGMRTSTQSSIDDLIADDSNSITGVEFDDAMTSFPRVHRRIAILATRESLLVLAFYVPGALYQQFAGVPQEDVDVAVEFVDDTTGDVLNTGTYQEMRKNTGTVAFR